MRTVYVRITTRTGAQSFRREYPTATPVASILAELAAQYPGARIRLAL